MRRTALTAAAVLALAACQPTEDDVEADGQPAPEDNDDVADEPGAPNAGEGMADDVIRLAVRYPDGETASTLEEPGVGFQPDEDEPEGPLLTHRRGMGTPVSWDYDLWLWPRPEAGEEPLELIAEWPDEGIDLTGAELDVEEITAAADRAVELWPEEGASDS